MTHAEKEASWKALQARMDADAAKRHAARLAVQEASDDKLRAVIDEAVRTAVQNLLAGKTPVVESALQSPPETPSEADVTPLHKLEPGAWQAHASQYWADQMTPKYQPMTMSEFLGSQPDDGAA